MRRREFITLIGGTTVSWPLAAAAQQVESTYRLAYLALLPGEEATLAKPFLKRLQELGFIEGKNLTVEYRSAEGRSERLARSSACAG